jgi:hypothetical protein
MIPRIVFDNPFFSWVLVSLLVYSGLFWAYYNGILAYVVMADFTHIALAILILFVYCNLSLGGMAFKLQQILNGDNDNYNEAYLNYYPIQMWCAIVPIMGLIGTVIGLSKLMRDAATVDVDTIVEMIGIGTGAALYPTGVGLFFVIVITFQRFLQTHVFKIYKYVR